MDVAAWYDKSLYSKNDANTDIPHDYNQKCLKNTKKRKYYKKLKMKYSIELFALLQNR